MSTAAASDTRLVAYGTLAPGRSNHHLVAAFAGTWREVLVRGRLGESGWSGYERYPAFVPDPGGPTVRAWLLESPDPASAWSMLDPFDGPGYRPVTIEVHDFETGEELGPASVYEALRMVVTGRPPRH